MAAAFLEAAQVSMNSNGLTVETYSVVRTGTQGHCCPWMSPDSTAERKEPHRRPGFHVGDAPSAGQTG